MSQKQKHSSTLYDDVFRAMLENIPFLFIPLVNEAFGTAYPMDAKIVQGKNEHVSGDTKLITDSCMEISSKGTGNGLYHIECQSRPDGNIAIRMMKYDFFIALENRINNNGIIELNFPESCALYLRHNSTTKDNEILRLKFPDGQKLNYTVPIIKVQNYKIDYIFTKKLFVLLPYYIMRYENEFTEIDKDEKRVEDILLEYMQIVNRLESSIGNVKSSEGYLYILDYMKKISDHILRKTEKLKERIGDFMKNTIITTRTDEIKNAARREGMKEGRKAVLTEVILNLHKHKMPISTIVEIVNLPEEDVFKAINEEKTEDVLKSAY